MDLRDRILYHQIHPLKLATDWGTAFGAAALFWQHRAAPAFALGLIPPVIVSLVLIRWGDLEPYRESRFGRYVARTMTRRVEGARLFGLLPFWGGAWVRRPDILGAGVAWICGCWLWGVVRGDGGSGPPPK